MAHHTSWLDHVIDKINPSAGAPPKPAPPLVDQNEWHQSVEAKHVFPDLTVRQIGLSVFGETRSFHNRPGSSEPIDAARLKVAHAMINDAELAQRTGRPRNPVHPPDEPTKKALLNSAEHAALDSSLRAAREAYLSGHDPTNGATHFSFEGTPTRANKTYHHGNKTGVAISTQSGPYNNSFLRGDVKSHSVWMNTYFPDQEDKKPRNIRKRP